MAKTGKKPPTKITGDSGNIVNTVRGLAEVATEHGISELIVDFPEAVVTIRRGAVTTVATVAQVAPTHVPVAVQQAPAAAVAPAAPVSAAPVAVADDKSHVVTSPFVGTFYRKPNPDASNYVNAGDKIVKGQVLCIVEAMKLMNEIEADAAGSLLAILVEDGSVVEYGQPLFKIAP